MGALKFSFFCIFIFILSSCSISAQNESLEIRNYVEGCFTLTNTELDNSEETVFLRANIDTKTEVVECPCKSALMQYSAFQNYEGQVSKLMSGSFSILLKEQIGLPIAVQKQLIFPEISIQVEFSCSSH